jgi:hypothetical protein
MPQKKRRKLPNTSRHEKLRIKRKSEGMKRCEVWIHTETHNKIKETSEFLDLTLIETYQKLIEIGLTKTMEEVRMRKEIIPYIQKEILPLKEKAQLLHFFQGRTLQNVKINGEEITKQEVEQAAQKVIQFEENLRIEGFTRDEIKNLYQKIGIQQNQHKNLSKPQ